MSRTRVRYRPEERQAKLDAAHERLCEAIESLVSSEDWLGYLRVMSRFHAYSPTNALLIACQRPDATLVAGYRKWPEFGRHVKKGAKAIQIFAPVTRKVPVEGEASEPSESGEPGAVRRLV